MKLLNALTIISLLVSQLPAHAQLFGDGAEEITGAAIVFYPKVDTSNPAAAPILDEMYIVTELIGTDKIAFKVCQKAKPQSECKAVGRADGYLMRAIKDRAQYFTDSAETAEDVFFYTGSGAVTLGVLLAFKRMSQPKAQVLGAVASVLAVTALGSELVVGMVNKKADVLNTSISQNDDLTFESSGLANSNQVEIQLTNISAMQYLERLQNLLMSVK